MMKNTPKKILIHCSDVSYKTIPDQFKSVNAYHRDERGFPVSSLGIYVGYHRFITGGKNYKCREDSDEGAHCNQLLDGVSLNFQSLGVCIGFDGDVEYPSADEYALLRKQVHDWQDRYNIADSNVEFHRTYTPWKTCPGKLIGNEWLKNLLQREPNTKLVEQLEKQEAIIRQCEKERDQYKSIIDKIRALFA